MAETTIDLKLYLSGTSAVEQGLGKLYQNLQKAEEQTEKFDKHLKGSVDGVTEALKVAAQQMENMGWEGVTKAAEGIGKVMEETTTSVRALNSAFIVLSGQSLVSTVVGLQQMTLQCGAAATAANVLAAAVTSLAGVMQLLTGVAAIAGAAFVGWQLGKVIGDLEVMGMTINDRVVVVMLQAMKVWAQFKHKFGSMDDESFGKEMDSLNKSLHEQLFPAQKGQDAARPAEDESAPGHKVTPFDHEKQRRAEQRLIASADAINIADADAARQTWAVKVAQGIKAINAEYEAWNQQQSRSLGEQLTMLEDTSTKEEKLLQQRADAEQKALQAREAVVQRKIRLMEEITNRTTEQNAELNELKAEEKRLLGESNVLTLQQDGEMEELTRRTQAKRVELFKNAQKQIDEMNKARVEKAQAAAKAEADGLENELTAKLDKLARERDDLEKDFRKTDKEKREEKIRLLKLEGELFDEHIGKLEKLAKLQEDEGARKVVDDRTGGARKRRGGVSERQRGMRQQPDPNSIRDQMTEVFVEMQNQMQTLAENIATMFKDIVNTAIDATAESIEGLIKGTMTWSQALQNIGDSILNTIISSFAKMAAQWIVNQILMWTVGKALGAASVAATAPMASASAAMWAGPALLSSVASYGAAVGAGQAALTSGLTANQASVKAFSASSGVMAAEGGLITGPGTGTSDSIPARLSNGEFVIPAKKVAEFGSGFFEGIRNGAVNALDLGVGAGGGRTAIPSVNLAAAAPKVNVQSAQPKVIVVNSQEELMRVMKGSVGEEITVAHIAKNKLRLGMAS